MANHSDFVFSKCVPLETFSFYEFSTFIVPFLISLDSSKQPSGYGKQRQSFSLSILKACLTPVVLVPSL